jgi:hypothetical protein
LSTFEGVLNYKSNIRTWKNENWRYLREDQERPSHYALDYRIVVSHFHAIKGKNDFGAWDYPGNLSILCHNQLADVIAVMWNLGFSTRARSTDRMWFAGEWQDFFTADGEVLFQVKAHINGNLHFRFMPKAIRRLNVEAGRLLGWLQDASDAVTELGYSPSEVKESFGANAQLLPSSVKMLSYQATDDSSG